MPLSALVTEFASRSRTSDLRPGKGLHVQRIATYQQIYKVRMRNNAGNHVSNTKTLHVPSSIFCMFFKKIKTSLNNAAISYYVMV